MPSHRNIELTAITARSAVALLTPDAAKYTLHGPLGWELRRGSEVVATGRTGVADVRLAARPLMACNLPPMRHAGVYAENAEVQVDAALAETMPKGMIEPC